MGQRKHVTGGEIPMLTEYDTIDPIFCVKEQGELKPHPLRDDRAVFVKSESGLIVVLGCAHRGVVNTLSYAQRLTGVEAVYALIGGTRLVAASLERIHLTVADLTKLDMETLGACHALACRRWRY